MSPNHSDLSEYRRRISPSNKEPLPGHKGGEGGYEEGGVYRKHTMYSHVPLAKYKGWPPGDLDTKVSRNFSP